MATQRWWHDWGDWDDWIVYLFFFVFWPVMCVFVVLFGGPSPEGP